MCASAPASVSDHARIATCGDQDPESNNRRRAYSGRDSSRLDWPSRRSSCHLRHRQLNVPLVIWRDGDVVEVSPAEVISQPMARADRGEKRRILQDESVPWRVVIQIPGDSLSARLPAYPFTRLPA